MVPTISACSLCIPAAAARSSLLRLHSCYEVELHQAHGEPSRHQGHHQRALHKSSTLQHNLSGELTYKLSSGDTRQSRVSMHSMYIALDKELVVILPDAAGVHHLQQ